MNCLQYKIHLGGTFFIYKFNLTGNIKLPIKCGIAKLVISIKTDCFIYDWRFVYHRPVLNTSEGKLIPEIGIIYSFNCMLNLFNNLTIILGSDCKVNMCSTADKVC